MSDWRDRRLVPTPREAVKALPPEEREEFLLHIIETQTGVGGDTGRFPGVHFTPLEHRVFCILYRHVGNTVPLGLIMDAVYAASDEPPSDVIVKVIISRIRKKLSHIKRCRIQTVWRVGYGLIRSPGYVFPWEGEE